MKSKEAEYFIKYTDHEDIVATTCVLTFTQYVPEVLDADHISIIRNMVYSKAGKKVEILAITRL